MSKERFVKYIGAHVSTAGGVENAPINAKSIGASAFAMFMKNQRQWKAKPYTSKNISLFKERCQEHGYRPEQILPHAGYLINLGNVDREASEKSLEAFIDEMQRCEQLGLKFLNVHPGAHLKKVKISQCLKHIATQINIAISRTQFVQVILENTAGQGTCLGHRFEELAEIIDQVEDQSRIGVCLDTCHAFSAGYNIKTLQGFKKTIDDFKKIVGLKKLKGFHLNDSKGTLGQRIDRHHSLGKGELGINVFKYIMKDSRFNKIPLILETIDSSIWSEEIKLLHSFK